MEYFVSVSGRVKITLEVNVRENLYPCFAGISRVSQEGFSTLSCHDVSPLPGQWLLYGSVGRPCIQFADRAVW